MQYWLMKSEPGCFSIDDLAAAPNQTSMWDGVRNYQARNYMRDSMKQGDLVLFYHSVTNPSIVGVMEVVSKAAYPDPTQWDPESEHYDPASPQEKPRWYLVDVKLRKKFKQPIPLSVLRQEPDLDGMELLRKGSRLSVQPVRPEEFRHILHMAQCSL